MRCPSCNSEIPENSEGVCPNCTLELTRPSSVARLATSQTSRELKNNLEAGTLLNERYRIVRLLGRGGMGTVYQAEDLVLEVPVALKFLTASAGDPEKRELFLNEVRLARQITHPNVCRVYDVGQVDSRDFLSMEYIGGEDLSSLLKRVGRLSLERALRIGLEICMGLEAAHACGILHRDLKPANLMIDTAGQARITDFGLASFAGSPDESGGVAGTLVYMAPEQIHGEVSVQSDLYALGLVLFELLTGKRAFKKPQVLAGAREPMPELDVPNMDPALAEIVLSCLERLPSKRPDSVRPLVAAFERGAAPPWFPEAKAPIPGRKHWALERRLGEGGFGEAWLGMHSKTGEQRVFKFCHDVAKLRTFQREITLFRLLKGELGKRDDIVSILDWSLDEPPYYIEAEFASGGNLRQWAKKQGGLATLPLDQRLELVAQIGTALAAAHSVGVMHKDVKPTNILIGDGGNVLLTDFGIGSLTERELLDAAGITVLGMTDSGSGTSNSSYAGTRLYMAPELLEGRGVTLHADVYALGVVLYQVVVGDFSRALAPGWRRDVNDELLREDIAAVVEGPPEQRLPCAQLAERLRSLPERRAQLAAEQRLQEDAERAQLALRQAERRRRWVAAGFGVLMLLGVAFALAFERGDRVARRALINQTLESHLGTARIAAAAVEQNLLAVQRRVWREAGKPVLRQFLENPSLDSPSLESPDKSPLQLYSEDLYESYKDRHFFSWVVADHNATALSRAPYDPRVVGRSYGYREWFSGVEETEGETPPAAPPRSTTGLTLAFESTATDNPILMSVAAPIPSDSEGRATGEPLGVLSASLHLATFNEWLESIDTETPNSGCPSRFVLLLHRGQLLWHPCPEAEAPRPPVRRFADSLQDLLTTQKSPEFRDPLRPQRFATGPPDLAVAVPLKTLPEWTVIVVQDREAALQPLGDLTGGLRWLGQAATVVTALLFIFLAAPFLRRRKES